MDGAAQYPITAPRLKAVNLLLAFVVIIWRSVRMEVAGLGRFARARNGEIAVRSMVIVDQRLIIVRMVARVLLGAVIENSVVLG